jgi:hypothetical protein
MLQWHRIHVAFVMNSQRASTSSLFRASKLVLSEKFLAVSRAAQAFFGQLARLNSPQLIEKSEDRSSFELRQTLID